MISQFANRFVTAKGFVAKNVMHPFGREKRFFAADLILQPLQRSYTPNYKLRNRNNCSFCTRYQAKHLKELDIRNIFTAKYIFFAGNTFFHCKHMTIYHIVDVTIISEKAGRFWNEGYFPF